MAAGFSRSLPLERFGSKLQFLVALVDRTEQWFNQWAFADLQGKEGLDGLTARIEAHLGSAMASWDATSALFLLYFESLTVVPELRPRVAAVGQAYRLALRDLIRQGQERGEIRADVDPDVEATALFGAIRGTIAQWLFEPKTIDLEARGAGRWPKAPAALSPFRVRPQSATLAACRDRGQAQDAVLTRLGGGSP